jgi:hypothetical protein
MIIEFHNELSNGARGRADVIDRRAWANGMTGACRRKRVNLLVARMTSQR